MFEVSGIGAGFDAKALNSITEPLGMVSIRKGRINKVIFDIVKKKYNIGEEFKTKAQNKIKQKTQNH